MKLNSKVNEPEQLSGLTLAYMGDAVMENYVRYRLISQGHVRPNKLHKNSTKYVSAKAQADILTTLFETNYLTEKEHSITMRGRNAKSGTIPKNTDLKTYSFSTAFEALLGYLYLTDQSERLDQVMERSFQYIEGKEEKV